MIGDGTEGWPARAPYDAIVAAAATARVPEGGRVVVAAVDLLGNVTFDRSATATRRRPTRVASPSRATSSMDCAG